MLSNYGNGSPSTPPASHCRPAPFRRHPRIAASPGRGQSTRPVGPARVRAVGDRVSGSDRNGGARRGRAGPATDHHAARNQPGARGTGASGHGPSRPPGAAGRADGSGEASVEQGPRAPRRATNAGSCAAIRRRSAGARARRCAHGGVGIFLPGRFWPFWCRISPSRLNVIWASTTFRKNSDCDSAKIGNFGCAVAWIKSPAPSRVTTM